MVAQGAPVPTLLAAATVRDMEGIGRPVGIWIIVVLQIFNAVVAIVDVVAGTDLSGGQLGPKVAANPIVRGVVLGWASALIFATVSLFLLRRRGWALMMLLVGVSLLAHLLIYWGDHAATQRLSMAVAAVTAFYLNSAAVRGLFLRHHEVSRITVGGRATQ